MRIVKSATFIVGILVVSFLVSWVVAVETQMQSLIETRKSALMGNIGTARFEGGNHASFLMLDEEAEDAGSTAQVLYMLKALNELNVTKVEKGLNYIISGQSLTIGNSTLWGWPIHFLNNWTYYDDLYVSSIITGSLRSFGAVDRVNKTALIERVLARYNESDGAFSEPIVNVNTERGVRQYAVCAFPLDFYKSSDVAYANSNMISTFLSVEILNDLNALNNINATRTINWILSSKAENGAFKPFPQADPFSSTNPFYVDRYGTGIAYTYAAIGALKALGVDVKNVTDAEKIRQYISASQEPLPYNTTRFQAHPDDTRMPDFPLTYYAIMTLYYIDALEKESEIVSKVADYLLKWLQDPALRFQDSWPIPTRLNTSHDWYGLFVDFTPLETTFYSIGILNITNRFSLLDEPTPIALKMRSNLLTLSTVVSVSSAGLALVILLVVNRIKSRNKMAAVALTKDNQQPITPQTNEPNPH